MVHMPPTDEALKQHVRRAHLQALFWVSADEDNPPHTNLNDYGWQQTADAAPTAPSPYFSVAEVAPKELLKVVACECAAEPVCSRHSCSCKAIAISCTSYCKCTFYVSIHIHVPIIYQYLQRVMRIL